MRLVRMLAVEGMLWLVKDVSAPLAWHDAFRKTTSVRKKGNAGRRSPGQPANFMPVIQPNSKGIISYPATAGISLLLVPASLHSSGVSKGQSPVFVRGFREVYVTWTFCRPPALGKAPNTLWSVLVKY